MSTRARFIMVGGFLGAGKTTALGRLARHFSEQGKRVGLITNDQASHLVDTLNLKSQGFAVEEIAGGCFCCRFSSLKQAADRLTATERPEVFLGEPVGSCTDLLATVAIPMQQMYGDHFAVAPLTVLVDPVRARKVLTNEKRGGFSPKVAYIYRKQLEEADAIAINKIDALSEPESAEIAALIREQYPDKRAFLFSARRGNGLEQWFEFAAHETVNWTAAMEMDYDTYADGEAELGWLNSACRMTADRAFDPNRLLSDIASGIRPQMAAQGAEIAHLKMTLISGMDLAIMSLVRNDADPELSRQIQGELTEGELTVNARAHIDPDRLRAISEKAVAEACNAQGIRCEVLSTEAFRPGRPEPEYRIDGPTLIGEER